MVSFTDLSVGLDHYDPEHRVFPHLPARLQAGNQLTAEDVLLILKWKLGLIKDDHSCTVNDRNLARINQAVLNAPTRKLSALNELDLVPGIGLAVATAILTVCYPDDFTIIDWRVLAQLNLCPKDSTEWTAEEYLGRYLPAVSDCAKTWGCPLRDADKALWGLSVHSRMKDIIDRTRAGSASGT